MMNFVRLILIGFLTSDRCIKFPFVKAVGKSLRCPDNWVKFDKTSWTRKDSFSCYKFVRSPKGNIDGAVEVCQTYQSKLMSFDASDDYAEHIFIKNYFRENDPLRRTWYIGVILTSLGGSGGIWEAEDGKRLPQSMMREFLPGQSVTKDKRYLAYSYSYLLEDWGFLMSHGDEIREFICEISSEDLSHVLLDAEDVLTQEYGMRVKDPRFIPRGPKFTRQPEGAMFDLLKRDILNQVSLRCLADGFPFPLYEWYKDSLHTLFNSSKVEPLKDGRITVSGGTLIINDPSEVNDQGNYYCKAFNKFGSIISSRAALSFANIGEFNLQRSTETGQQYWGKAIYCDPPRFYPDARFYWNHDFFPNFVEENERTLVSRDGNLYFSFLDRMDEGLYSCTAQSTFSDIGRHGPFFRLKVELQSHYQQLTFANHFPKSFPEAPVSGDEVRLECIAFGYPLPSYSWKKRNGELPRKSKLLNYHKVLIIPKVELTDVGEYVCKAQNDRMAIEAILTLAIQTTPIFTLPIRDKYVNEGDDVTFVCEAFAIPDVEYSWIRNSQPILTTMTTKLKDKYLIKNNVLKVINVTYKDQTMYQCRATNMLGSSLSTAQLKILAVPPTFYDDETKKELYALESSSITIPCRPEASPIPHIQWFRDHHLIDSSVGRLTILQSGDLQIYPVDFSDEGEYSCTATNKFNSSTAIRNVKVLNKPYESNNETRVATVGEDLTLSCNLNIGDMLEVVYVWRINDVRIEIADDHLELEEEDNDFLDTTYYQDSYYPAQDLEEPPTEYFRKRYPPYTIGFDSTQLVVRSITLEDSGHYSCEVKTPIASFSHWTDIIVFGPPGPVGGLMASDVTSTTAKLIWTNGHENGSPIQTYIVRGQMIISNEWVALFEIEVSANNTSQAVVKECILPPKTLNPYSTYRFQVSATNNYGSGIMSHPSSSVNTKYDVPFYAPQQVGGGGGKIGDLTITWEPLNREHQNAAGIFYIVYWRRVPRVGENQALVEFNRKELKHLGNIGVFVTTVDTQLYYTKYEVKVQSVNKMGFGPTSESAFIYSAENYPEIQPTEVRAISYNATALNVTWRPITPSRGNIRGKLMGYRIKYWRDDHEETESQIRLHVNATHHGLVVGLVPDTMYWVRVMAYNSAGSGPESEKFRERTLRYPPLTPPNAVRVTSIDPETIFVTWRGITPSAIEEPLLGYKVRVWKVWEDMTAARDTVVLLGSQLECLIGGLDFGHIYKLRALAFSQGGDGKMSSPPVLFSLGDPSYWTSSTTVHEHTTAIKLYFFIYIVVIFN